LLFDFVWNVADYHIVCCVTSNNRNNRNKKTSVKWT